MDERNSYEGNMNATTEKHPDLLGNQVERKRCIFANQKHLDGKICHFKEKTVLKRKV